MHRLHAFLTHLHPPPNAHQCTWGQLGIPWRYFFPLTDRGFFNPDIALPYPSSRGGKRPVRKRGDAATVSNLACRGPQFSTPLRSPRWPGLVRRSFTAVRVPAHHLRTWACRQEMVGVFGLSVPKATFQKVIPTPGVIVVVAIEYDTVRDTVWIVASSSCTHNTLCV